MNLHNQLSPATTRVGFSPASESIQHDFTLVPEYESAGAVERFRMEPIAKSSL